MLLAHLGDVMKKRFYLLILLCSFINVFAQEKLRVLYILQEYPSASETYMHEEIASLWDTYDIKIITIDKAWVERKNSFPYVFINQNEQDFLKNLAGVIKSFQPHVMHMHWFTYVPLVGALSQYFNIPFTVRTHSFDILSSSKETLKKYCNIANSRWCLGVLCFPAFEKILIDCELSKDKILPCWPVINYQRFYNPKKLVQTNRVLSVGAALPKKDYNKFIDLADIMRDSGMEFNLFITSYAIIDDLRSYNKQKGTPVKTITWVEPEEMPNVYQQHDWLVYTSNPDINTVGLPVGIAEAQASGIAVCWQELPGRREEQLEFLGGAGYLFKSIEEVPALIQQPYPEEMRLKGLENAKKCDIELHKVLLTQVWDNILEQQE